MKIEKIVTSRWWYMGTFALGVTILALGVWRIREDRERVEELRGEYSSLEEAASKVAVLGLDIASYAESEGIERYAYSDHKVIQHFVQIGLPQGVAYTIVNPVDEAMKILLFWQNKLQELKEEQKEGQS